MFRLLWKLIKFTFAVFLFSLAITIVGAVLDLIVKYWVLILIIAVLSISAYYFVFDRSREKKAPKHNVISHTTHILDNLDTLMDKRFSNTIETAVTARNEMQYDESSQRIPRNLNVLLEEEGQPAIETEQQLQDFLNSHVLIRSFITRVVGVSYPNDDGSSRQEILSRCLRGEPVGFYWYTYDGEPACAIISDHGQIGHLKADLAKDIDYEYSGDEYCISGQISDITGGEDGLYYGCNILLSIYGPMS